jgi:hypothetical protein
MNQIATWPVDVLRQRMSALPLPSKSPTPAAVHAVGASGSGTFDAIAVPFMSHTAPWPAEVSRQTMSIFWSPLKSCTGVGTASTVNWSEVPVKPKAPRNPGARFVKLKSMASKSVDVKVISV